MPSTSVRGRRPIMKNAPTCAMPGPLARAVPGRRWSPAFATARRAKTAPNARLGKFRVVTGNLVESARQLGRLRGIVAWRSNLRRFNGSRREGTLH